MPREILLRFSSNYGPNEWAVAGCNPNHHLCVDDIIGSEPDGNYWQSGKNSNYESEVQDVVLFINVRANSVSYVRIYYFCGQTTFDCGIAKYSFNSRIYFNGAWQSQIPIQPVCIPLSSGVVYGWKNVEWSSLAGSQDDMVNLLVETISPTSQGLLDILRIESIYLQVELDVHNHKNISRHINRGINMGVN